MAPAVDPSLLARLQANLSEIRQRSDAACARAGRNPADVRLLAVTKYFEPAAINALKQIGVLEFGESRAQHLADRARTYGAHLANLDAPLTADAPRWHMIGHLQRNKVRALLRDCRVIHSVDSERLVEHLDQEAERGAVGVDAFLEINTSGEAAKSGAPLDQAQRLAARATAARRLRLVGLMTMAPLDGDLDDARRCFAQLRQLGERLRQSGDLPESCTGLSMGMSRDFEVAIEEGATWIRLGSILVEERK